MKVCVLQILYVKTLLSNVIVWGECLWAVIRIRCSPEGGTLMNEISALRRVTTESLLSLFALISEDTK